MGFYTRVVFPRLLDWVMDSPQMTEQRRLVLGGVSGDVLEIGFGTGLNLPHYPAAVRSLTAIDSNPGMTALAQRRIARSALLPRHAVLDGQRLSLAAASFDAVVSTWTLCSIPDLGAALGEVRRVLRAGGRLHFVEHGLSPDPRVQAWQQRLNPIQRRIGDGCNLNRDFRAIIVGAGFRLDRLDTFYLAKGPRFASYFYRGVATPA